MFEVNSWDENTVAVKNGWRETYCRFFLYCKNVMLYINITYSKIKYIHVTGINHPKSEFSIKEKIKNFILSQFWRLKVRRAMISLKALGKSPS